MISLSREECLALWRLIDDLSGGEAEYPIQDDSDTTPTAEACRKVYREAGELEESA